MSSRVYGNGSSPLLITSFYGGPERGRCIQLTLAKYGWGEIDRAVVEKDTAYLQLERGEVWTIVRALLKWLRKGDRV